MISLVKESFITLVSRGLGFAASLLINIIVARGLGPAGKGSYTVLMLIITIETIGASLGQPLANVYFSSNSPTKRGKLIGNSFVVAIVSSIMVLGIVELVVLHPLAQDYLLTNSVSLDWVRFSVFMLPIVLFNRFLLEVLRGSGFVFQYNVGTFFIILANLLALFGFAVFSTINVQNAILAWGGAQLAGFALTVGLLYRYVAVGWSFDFALLKESLRFGLRGYPGDIIQFLNLKLDVILIGLFLGQVDVGLYSVATGLAEKILEVPYAIIVGLVPRLALDVSHASMRTEQISRIAFLLVGVMCFVLALLSFPLIYILYGAEYSGSVLPLVFLLPGIWMLTLGRILSAYYIGIGRPQVNTYATMISLFFTVVLDIFLIPRFGIIGASMASSIAYSATTLALALSFFKFAESSATKLLVIQQEDIELLRKNMMKFSRFLSVGGVKG